MRKITQRITEEELNDLLKALQLILTKYSTPLNVATVIKGALEELKVRRGTSVMKVNITVAAKVDSLTYKKLLGLVDLYGTTRSDIMRDMLAYCDTVYPVVRRIIEKGGN